MSDEANKGELPLPKSGIAKVWFSIAHPRNSLVPIPTSGLDCHQAVKRVCPSSCVISNSQE